MYKYYKNIHIDILLYQKKFFKLRALIFVKTTSFTET